MSNLSALTAPPAENLLSDKKGHLAYTICVVGATFLAGYLFSLWLLSAYYLGDPEHYTRFYNSLHGMPPRNWEALQRSYLGSAEPLYRYIIGIAAYFGVDRIQYLSVWNGIFTGLIGYIALRYRASIIFSALIFTNYYLLVLLGSAERLKFSYIFLALGLCLSITWKRYTASVLAVFFHTQALIQFISSFMYYLAINYRVVFSNPTRTIIATAGLVISLGVSGFLFSGSAGDVIVKKSAGYFEKSGGAMEIIQWALLLVAGVYVFREKIAFTAGMLPVGIFTFLYGNRVNVATFSLFAIMAMINRKTNHPVVLLVMAYMSFKSIQFIIDVVKFGTGYP